MNNEISQCKTRRATASFGELRKTDHAMEVTYEQA